MVRKTSGNIRGCLFQVIVRSLLEKDGLVPVRPDAGNRSMVRRMKNDVIELRGRGCWHAVDCPYLLVPSAPFLPPVRVIGLARYHMSEIKKESVRNFVGILTDLEEGRYLPDSAGNGAALLPRTDVGVYFAANGFWPEAERLAASHGIRTVSYRDNRQMARIKELIFALESRYLDYDMVMQQGNFIPQFAQVLSGTLSAESFASMYGLSAETVPLMEELGTELSGIKTSFFAATPTGMLLHFLSSDTFPEELFAKTDRAQCRVRLLPAEGEEHACYLQFEDDAGDRRFYFSPPASTQEQLLYGRAKKGTGAYTLCASVRIGGLARTLVLTLDPDWRSALAF